MTKREIAEMLGYHEGTVLQMFQKVCRNNPDEIAKTIKLRSAKAKKEHQADFKFDEVMYVLERTDFITPMQIQYVKENFIYRDTSYKPTIKNRLTRDEKIYLFWKYARHKNLNVCNECIYCSARKRNFPNARFRPYCDFYGFFIQKRKMNVYKDSCKTFTRRFCKTSEIRIWSLPANTDLITNKNNNKILGIDKSEFISTRPKDEPIVLLSNGGKDEYNFP